MTAQELGVVRSVLVSLKAIDATASDGDVSAAHAAMLSGPNATEYKATLTAQGVQVGPSWLMILGVVGGAVALYYVWKHYQREQLDVHDYPEPRDMRHQIRGMGRALGAFRGIGGHTATCSPRVGGHRMGRAFGAGKEKYEFEPEIRLEGYRRRKARRA